MSQYTYEDLIIRLIETYKEKHKIPLDVPLDGDETDCMVEELLLLINKQEGNL